MKKILCSFCGKEQKEVVKIIASPNGEAYICDDCVNVCQNMLKEKEYKMSDITLSSPEEIKNHLDKFIISQDRAKRVLSVAVYNHYKRLKYNSGKSKKIVLEKSNILLCGPTGTGKTLLCKRLAEYLKVPFAEADATTLTEAGYVGDDVESVLYKLLVNADFDVKKAETGIVYIDEIDKISRRSVNKALPKDPTGEGVQQGLLKMLEGKVLSVPTTSRRVINQEFVTMDTSQILFICGGAFVGLNEIIKKRTNKSVLGFENGTKKSDDTANKITPQDLINYGMIPEFVGRLPIIATLEELRKEDLEKILYEPENSLINQYKTLLRLDGIELDIDKEAISILAERAFELNTGARGLKSVFDNMMNDIMFYLPGKNINKFVINRELVTDKKCYAGILGN